MSLGRRCLPAAVAILTAVVTATPARAEDLELTLYSGRHYQSDDKLYAHFTEKTGIKVNRIQGKEEELLERLKIEGASSPADVFITTDAARLGEAEALGLFAPVESKVLDKRIPAALRTATWFAFSTRARVIVFDRAKVKADEVRTYADLANPRLKGKLCVRSGSHPYNLSLGSALLAHIGEVQTEAWARGVVANFARAPKGGDTDQILAVGAGECQVALVNSYYLARLLRSAKKEERELMTRVRVAWPDQSGRGTHVNVSGGGVLKTATHKDAAVTFLEYLASDAAQSYFAVANNEWPVVKTAVARNAALDTLGTFKADPLDVGTLSRNAVRVQKSFERAGWR
jgi:iron(III) transport system substrate-binding protein